MATTTNRLLTFVIRTRPTFSAKATYGKEFRTPPRAVAAPSARRARATVSLSTSLPTMSPTAYVSPVVSTIVISMTISMRTIGNHSNFGTPKWKGW